MLARARIALFLGTLLLVAASTVLAAEAAKPAKSPPGAAAQPAAKDSASPVAYGPDGVGPGTAGSSGGGSSGAASGSSRPGTVPFGELLKDGRTIEGLIKLHRKDDRLYAELSSGLLDRDFIVIISIARGIGERPLLGGMSWGFDDDWVWQFRKVEEKIQVVRRNVRFTAARGSPEERAVRLAYTDSVLFSLPIVSTSPSGGHVVDLGPVLMSDLPQISSVLPGFVFARDRSSWAAVKGFRDNVEIEVAATYASAGQVRFDTVPDSRGVTINVHYSISLLPQTGYQPRLADDRVGYFLSATKDFSRKFDSDRFVRYINRWNLQKADASAELSPPKKPIIFWLEKTVPFEYRKAIREGILEWNKAFEKAGFANAVEVRQQPDDADWDPEDINYNTFRWITSGVGMAMGPSRVNPLTGEILDADIIFDADFLSFWKDEYDLLSPKSPPSVAADQAALAALTGVEAPGDVLARHDHDPRGCACQVTRGMASQLALAAAAAAAPAKPMGQAEFRRLVQQAVKWVAMHEVGHTLGLRHNFKASSLYTLEELNTPEKTRDTGLGASVMDYMPVNYMPKGHKQGDYFSVAIGPYDLWAIEYGYKSLSGGIEGEAGELKKIAARAAEPGLAYAPDEDCRLNDPDPLVNRFDLGKDPLQFAKVRKELVAQLIPGLAERMTDAGDGYHKTRQAFQMLLHNQSNAMHYVARTIGGVYSQRTHKGDPGAKPPFVVVEAARQREALAMLRQDVFGEKAFEFPAELYNMLVEGVWMHWGLRDHDRRDFPIREIALGWQDRVLAQLLSSITLARLTDSEMKIPADQDAFTAAELLAGLTAAIFSETDRLQQGEFTNRKPAVSSLRRDLQRRYVERLSALVLGTMPTPKDCQTLAYAELEGIEARLNGVLGGKAKLDAYSRAHFKETAARVHKVLEARLEMRNP